jgi:Asp-tRNA(Asn)/Glu-tRNA(Gln) amidotransferase A subunit family amidase
MPSPSENEAHAVRRFTDFAGARLHAITVGAIRVPTGLVNGLPVGVQIVSTKFREDRMLAAGEVIERAAGFSALDHLLSKEKPA